MIDYSEAFAAAITADARRILLKAVIDIIDPDITFGAQNASGSALWSKSGQLLDKEFSSNVKYATLEPGKWLLDGSYSLIPDDNNINGQVGYVGDVLSGGDGTFANQPWVEITFSNVSILQACSVFFPAAEVDGIPEDFTVEVKQGGVAYFTQTVTGNTKTSFAFSGFTVYNPDAIRITVSKWSLPGRRMRVVEIVPGIYEEWGSDIIASFSVVQQSSISCLSLPYGTCSLRMDNLDRRFEPRSKTGVFQSIEERQGITVSIGVRLENGKTEYKPVGVFFQANGGWKTGDNGITMRWNLVDIVGLLVDRAFIVPSTLPTTLGGWISSIVAQLGDNFTNWWHVDPNYIDLPCIVNSAADVANRKCGEVLRYACMATGTWPRADAETGYLTVEPLWSQGNKLDLDNMNTYPVMRANDDIAALIFNIYDGNNTQYVVSGTSAASANTANISNPFIHDTVAALTAARQILAAYGGNVLQTTGRGNPSSEIGDVDTVWLNESTATTGRRLYQTFTMQGGVLQGCESRLLQADGSFQFEERVVLTGAGEWTAPAGVTQLRVIDDHRKLLLRYPHVAREFQQRAGRHRHTGRHGWLQRPRRQGLVRHDQHQQRPDLYLQLRRGRRPRLRCGRGRCGGR